MIYIVRTTRGREKAVMEALEARLKSENFNVSAIFYPFEIKGYIFVEGEDVEVERLLKNVPYVKGFIKKEVPVSDLERFLSEKPKEIDFVKGDIVVVIGGPFKDEVGRVERVDKVNREVVIELLDAAVPIPLTIDAELLRKKGE